jgi:hypothetical protein
MDVAFSSDGRHVLTGSSDCTARLWNARTGQQEAILKGPMTTVLSVAFSPDGKTVLTGSDDGTARLWDARTGQWQIYGLMLWYLESLTSDAKSSLTAARDWIMRACDTVTLQRGVPPPRSRGGKWKLAGKELVQEALDNEALFLFGDPRWTDYDLSVEVMTTGGAGEVSAIVRAAGLEDFTVVLLGGWKNTFHGILPVSSGQFLDASAAPGKTAPNQWYRLKAEVRGKACRLLLDSKPLTTSTIVPSPRGRVGVRTVSTAARFRNFKVTDPAGKVLFEGLPPLPGASDRH